MAISSIKHPVRVGKSQDGKDFLIADQDDIDNDDYNGPAYIERGDGTKSELMPLQRFFKFGVWLPIEGES